MADGVGWSAPRVGTQDNRVKSALRGAQLLRGRSADTPRGKKREGRGARNSNVVLTTFRTLCRRPLALFTRSSVDWQRADECAPRRVTTQPRQVRTARLACCVGGRRYSVGRKARGPHVTVFERNTYGLPKPVPPTYRGAGAVELRSTGYGGARPALFQSTTTQPRQVRTARLAGHAPWAVGPYFAERKARGVRATRFERNECNLSNRVPPTCRGIGAVDPRPTAWGGARPALGHNTTAPSPHCAAHVFHGGRPILYRAKKRAGPRHEIQIR